MVKIFSKVGFVAIFFIPILLIFSLVAPKAKAYDETVFTSISYGKSPSALIDWARTFTSDIRADYNNNIVYVYTYNNYCFAYVYFLDDSITTINCPTNKWGNPTSNVSAFCVEFVYNSSYSVSSHGSGNRTVYFDGENNHISSNYGNIWTNNITLTFDNGSVTPTPIQNFVDDLLVYTSGWLINYNVGCTSQSQHSGWWWFTRRYKCRITATYNNQPIILDIPNYVSWDMNIRTLTSYKLGDSYGSLPDPLSSVQDYYQTISYVNYEAPVLLTISTPEREWDSVTDIADTSLTSNMTVSLYQVLEAFRASYPSFTFSDDWLYQDISFSFIGYDDNKTYYTQVLTYSVVTDRTEAPPDLDTTQPNWFDNRQTVINNINENSTYDYLSKPPERWSQPPRLSGLESIPSIDSPDYSFPDISSLDGTATDFFSWLVNLVVSSPIGLLILIGLGFLVVKAVVHQ